MIRPIKRLSVVLVVLSFLSSLHADGISLIQARIAAENWIADPQNTLQVDFAGRGVASAITYNDVNGNPAFHCVSFDQGGFVVTSTDDGILPIVAFSDSGTLDADPDNPLWAMLNDDMPKRTAAAQSQQKLLALGLAAKGVVDAEIAENQANWDRLITGGVNILGLTSVPDVRVDPLVQSLWSQSTVSGLTVYNYYTPNNSVCGCVATAMAQVMRFHQYPTASVTAQTKNCSVNGVWQNLTMQGGTYTWSSMPLAPNSSITVAQRQAIGKLTSDVGISVCMQYTASSSGANSGIVSDALPTVFGYANAKGYTSTSSLSAAIIQRAILSSLDGGYPVILGISGSDGGHAVVGDGYGYSSSSLYVHLNMGWSGNQNAWYNLPNVDDALYGFSSLNSVVYNVFPTGTGEYLSGRVTDLSGVPLSGATVTAVRSGSTSSDVTDARGIYAIRVAGGYSYSVTASYAGNNQSSSVSVSSSVSTTYSEPNIYFPGTGVVGNSWGNNFSLSTVSTPPSAPTGVTAADGTSTANVTISWSASSGATSYSVWRGTSSSSASTTSLSSTVTTTSYSDTSATPGVVYYYWVKATGSGGTSGLSGSNTGYRKLSVPTGVSATDGNSTANVTVTWSTVTGASHYRVYRATTSSGTKTALGSWQTGLSYADTSAVAGTTYYYFVMAAVDSSGTRPSDYSSNNTGYRGSASIPSPPAGITAADGASTASVAVTWTASSGATSYSVWRGMSSSSSAASSLSSSVATATYTDTTAAPGVLYYYWVKAINSSGTSGFSSGDTGYRKLTTPTGVSATTTDPSKVHVSWSSASGASYYRVSRASTSTSTKTVVSVGWQSALAFDDTTPTIGTTFYYFVEAAVDGAGARPSAYSAYATGMRPLPTNDAFASAVALSGNSGSAHGSSEGATKQTGEPEHNGEATAVNSVWWTWTAPSSGQAIFDTLGSTFDTVLAVYTGTAVGSLTPVASNDDAVGTSSRVTVNATAGTVYRIAVAGYGGEYGTVVLNWSFVSAIEPTIKSSGITTISGTMYFQVNFKAKAGKTYTVLRKDTLASPSWTSVSSVSATVDGLKSVNIAILSNKPTGYYCVKTTE